MMQCIRHRSAQCRHAHCGGTDSRAASARGAVRRSPFRPAIIAAAVALLVLTSLARAHTADPYAPFVSEAAQRFGLPASWIRAVMRAESAGDPRAVSSKGAMGLMQIMPATWAELRLRHGLGGDPFSPRDNILAGAAYLREMHDRYGSVALMLAAYNAGPARTDEHLAAGRALPAETRAYVAALVPELAADTAPMIPAPTHAAPADDLFAAPIFVARAGGPDAAPVRTDARRVAALTADEARFMAWQSGLFATPPLNSERQAPAEESAARLQPERRPAAHEARPPGPAATLFVPRSQPRQRP